MKNTDKAYLAGIIDSDGCISIQKYSNCGSYRVILTVVQRDMGLIEYLYSIFGCSVNVVSVNRKYGKQFYLRWVATDKKAHQLLKLIFPYLRLKRKQAELAIALYRAKLRNKKGGRYSTCAIKSQKNFFIAIKNLNSPATTERVSSLTKEMRQSELVEMINRQRENRSILSA
jgi:hypothetical protein